MREQMAQEHRIRAERWAAEAGFSDTIQHPAAPIHPLIIERYAKCSRRDFYESESFFAHLADVKGKRVLDIGCGAGDNAILLALRGARVTGIDISQKAIAAARSRAAHHSVGGLTEFVCSPVELFRTTKTFDIVIGQAILHHIIPELDATFRAIAKLAIPGALCVFQEPVNLSPWWRKFRLMLPIPVYGTVDERPLEVAELRIIKRYLRDLEMRSFLITARLMRFFPDGPYELAPGWVRLASDVAVW